jgi:hypothetical protein
MSSETADQIKESCGCYPIPRCKLLWILPASFEPRHRLVHQLGQGAQIPKRVDPANVPEVGGQKGQAPLGILAGAIPPQ